MRWVYAISLASGKGATVPSLKRIYDPLRVFRDKFGEEAVLSVTERHGNGEPVPSHLLPTCPEEAESLPKDDQKARIVRAIDKFYERK
jgi:hypothetical protein